MKGVIFNLFEDAVVSRWGDARWESLLDQTGLDGVYTSLGSYPDENFLALVEATATEAGESVPDVVRWFGRSSIPRLAETFPEFFDGHTTVGTFLLTLNDIIHAEVRKLYPDADVPEFSFEVPGDGTVRIEYRSHRKMCPLAEGFIEGAADHFHEQVTVEQPECMLRGDDRCVLECEFVPV